MLKYFLFTALLTTLCLCASGQKIAKPTLIAQEPTAEQKQLISEGIKLHDQKQYGEAIKKYQLVLNANPACTFAMYEMAMSLYSNGNLEKAMDLAVNGSKYRSKELPLFYLTIGNALDDVGKHKEAIKIYRDALDILEKDNEMMEHVSSVRYNLAITYYKQKQYTEARTELKKAVEANQSYASPHYLLAELFYGLKYRIPAFLAASRLISLEVNTSRADRAVAIVNAILKPAEKDPKTGNINIFLDLNSPKDEGDYSMFDLLAGTLMTVKADEDKNKSEEEIFAGAVDTIIALVVEDKKLGSTFVGKHYVPFFAEMKRLGHSKAFSYIVLYKSGNQQAAKWLTENGEKMKSFLAWSREFRPSR
jgi:tetratricopeptide (TPR) repeat protein